MRKHTRRFSTAPAKKSTNADFDRLGDIHPPLVGAMANEHKMSGTPGGSTTGRAEIWSAIVNIWKLGLASWRFPADDPLKNDHGSAGFVFSSKTISAEPFFMPADSWRGMEFRGRPTPGTIVTWEGAIARVCLTA
jgi:hypothetical protein